MPNSGVSSVLSMDSQVDRCWGTLNTIADWNPGIHSMLWLTMVTSAGPFHIDMITHGEVTEALYDYDEHWQHRWLNLLYWQYRWLNLLYWQYRWLNLLYWQYRCDQLS